MRNWIIWHYTFGQQMKNKFARAHTHIFYFVNDKNNFTFNDKAVRIPSDRQLLYNDKRANPAGKMPDDVWNTYSRVCGTFRERTGWHPCQMPENLLKRIISASSNPGDFVLDPFCGSGTTPAAALQLSSRYASIEISQEYVNKANKRLEKLQKTKSAKPPLSIIELSEIKRLSVDMGKPLREIAADKKLLKIFANQFTVRMNNKKKYTEKEIATAVIESAKSEPYRR